MISVLSTTLQRISRQTASASKSSTMHPVKVTEMPTISDSSGSSISLNDLPAHLPRTHQPTSIMTSAFPGEGQDEQEPPHPYCLPTSSSTAGDSPIPPEGGLRAWTQVFMGHLCLINSLGYLTSFGLFQSYYRESLDTTHSAISWVGSVQIFLVYFVGSVSGRALDAGYYRHVISLGTAMQIMAVFSIPYCTEYWHLFLAKGLCKGIGDGLIFCPTVALVATYFKKRRALALACTTSGAATGGVIFTLIAQQLLHRVGFAWTVRVMGFVILFNGIVILMIARVRMKPRTNGLLFEWSAFKEAPYSLFCAGMFLNLWAVYFAYFYITIFGKSILGVDHSTSLIILLVLSGVGLPGRILCGWCADHVGSINTLTPVAIISGLLLFCWAAINSFQGLLAFCVIYGLFAAGVQSLFPAASASLTTDLKKMGSRTGMCFSVVSLACLTGPPLTGHLIKMANGNFLYAQVFGGCSFMVGCSLLIGARVAKYGWTLKHKM